MGRSSSFSSLNYIALQSHYHQRDHQTPANLHTLLSLSLSLSLISFSWSGLLFYFIIIILFLKFSFFTLSYHSPRQDFYRFDSFEITSPTRVLFTLQLVFKSKSNTLRLGLSFPLLVICHIKIVKYINKKKIQFLKLIIYIIEINIENS